VGEGLRIVPQLFSARRVGLLGEETERPGEVEQALEQLDGLVDGTGCRKGLDKPERARQERALTAAQPVVAHRIAVDQRPAGRELAPHGVDRGGHARRTRGFEAEQRENEKRSVKVASPVRAHERSALRVDTVGDDIDSDRVTLSRPSHPPSGPGTMGVGDAQRPVERQPGHELGVNIVGRIAAHLP